MLAGCFIEDIILIMLINCEFTIFLRKAAKLSFIMRGSNLMDRAKWILAKNFGYVDILLQKIGINNVFMNILLTKWKIIFLLYINLLDSIKIGIFH